jgi:Protein of unknown function (DUF3300)
MILRMLRPTVFAFLIVVPFVASAQSPAPSSVPPAAASDQQLLKPAELDALVAPIALYPDTLLAEVLMASTYPVEVVQADRWANANKNLKEDQLKAAVDKQGWDNSVKALIATPSVLTMMSTKLDWTQKIGDAFLAQQADVMDAVQRLRGKAQANNKLTSTKEQKVTVRQEQNRQVIAIEPAEPNSVSVPYYDPAVVYGAWPYADDPPYYFPEYFPGYIGAGIIATGIAFGAGYALGRWVSRGNYWGGGINWGRNAINVNRPVVNPLGGNAWQHNPAHRGGVRYNNVNVQQRFGNANIAAGNRQRPDFHGSGGQQVLKPGGGAANRPSAGALPANRPTAKNRLSTGVNRPTAANRPSLGANRPSAGNRPSSGANPPTAKNRPAQHRVASRPFVPSRANLGGHAGGGRGAAVVRGGGGMHAGGGLSRGGGGMHGGGGRGGRRSDLALKHDVVLLGRLENGLGFYRFGYNGGDKAYVGVIAQEVQTVIPDAVVRGPDGYLRVFYDKLGVPFQTYDRWIASGARIPSRIPH